MYRITIDREACVGIFACLVRDDRFREGEDGLATLEGEVRRDGEHVIAEFAEAEDPGGLDRAREAARACPPGAISVTRIEDGTPVDGPEHAEVDGCP